MLESKIRTQLALIGLVNMVFTFRTLSLDAAITAICFIFPERKRCSFGKADLDTVVRYVLC